MSSILEKVDVFGIPIGLNYKNDGVYKTMFGGITTLVFVAMMATLFFNSVTYTSSPSIETEPGIIEINTNKYMIATKVDQDNFIQNPYYNLTFEIRHYIRYDNGTYIQNKTPIQLEPCTWDHFKDLPNLSYDWKDAFELQDLSDFLCLQKNQTYLVGGKFENPDFYHLKFKVTQCKNSTNTNRPWQPVCKSPADILAKQTDEDTRIDFLFTNYNLNPEKPSDISQIYLESMFFTFQPKKMYSTANIFINEKTVTTDNSLLPFADTSDLVFPIYDNGDYKQQYAVGDYSNFCEIFFLRSNRNVQINRQFQKIDEVISYIGGFAQIFLLIFALAVRIYNSYHYQLELINKLYDFEFPNDEDKDSYPNDKNTKGRHIASTTALTKQNAKITPMDTAVQTVSGQQKTKQENNQMRYEHFDKQQMIREANKRYSVNDSSPSKVGSSSQSQYQNKVYRHRLINNSQHANLYKDLNSPSATLSSPMKRIKLERMQYSGDQTPTVLPLQYSSIQDKFSSLCQVQEQIKDSSKEQTPPQHIELYNYDKQQEFTPLENDLTSKHVKREEGFKESMRVLNGIPSYHYNGNGMEDSQYYNAALPNTTEDIMRIQKGVKYYNAQQFLEREMTSYIRKENPMKLSLQYFINSITFGKLCNTPEVQLLNKANDMLSRDIDLYELIKCIKEINKLKKLLLNPEQESLFNFFPKPLVTLEEDESIPQLEVMKSQQMNNKIVVNQLLTKQKISSFKSIALVIKAINRFKMNLKKNQSTQIKKLYDAYVKIKHSDNIEQQEINDRLIKLLGKDLTKIFEAARRIYIKTDEQIYKEMLEMQSHLQNNEINNNLETEMPLHQEQSKFITNDIEAQNNNSSAKNLSQKEGSSEAPQSQIQQIQQPNILSEPQQPKEQNEDASRQLATSIQVYAEQNNVSILNGTDNAYLNTHQQNGEFNETFYNNNNMNNTVININSQQIEANDDFNVYKSYNLTRYDLVSPQQQTQKDKPPGFEVISPMQSITKQKIKKNNFLGVSPKTKKKK